MALSETRGRVVITTTVCDAGQHKDCPGQGLVSGKGEDEGWVHVGCECRCHKQQSDEERCPVCGQKGHAEAQVGGLKIRACPALPKDFWLLVS